ncbi:MAG: hypothetical protein V7647_2951 [Acidobacteriota bacterium]
MRRRRAERCLVRADLAFHAGFVDEARAATDEARDLDPDLPALVAMEALLGGKPAELELPRQFDTVEPPPIASDHAETRRQAAAPVEVEWLTGATSPAVDPPLHVDVRKASVLGPKRKKTRPQVAAPVEVEALPSATPRADLPLHVDIRKPAPLVSDRGETRRRPPYPVALALGCACVALVAAASLGWHAVLRPPAPEPANTALRGNVTLPADPVLDTAPPSASSAIAETAPVETPAPEPEPSAILTSGETRSAVREAPRRDDAVRPALEPSRRDDAVKPPPAAPPTRSERGLTEGTPAPRFTATPSIPASTSAADPGPRREREEPVPSFKPPAVEPVPLSASALPATGSIPAAPEPTPAAPSRARSPEPAAAVVDPQAAIRATLSRYEAAYSGLNVSAARAVWPAVDERALARAFDGLASQRVALEKCDVAVSGTTARATCSGSADWTPKVGGGQRHQNRRWAFELANAGGTWQIVRAETR